MIKEFEKKAKNLDLERILAFVKDGNYNEIESLRKEKKKLEDLLSEKDKKLSEKDQKLREYSSQSKIKKILNLEYIYR